MMEMVIKLVFSLLFGMLIGMDREMKQKPLGVKPCMVISIASCMVTIVSIESFAKFAGPTHPNMDPMRLAAQIVSGVGFLGAGVILRRNNDAISGLTSAALIWGASGLGITVGAGFYLEAVCAVVLFIVAVNGVPSLLKIVGPRTLRQRNVLVKIVMEPNMKMTELLRTIERKRSEQGQKKGVDYNIKHIKLKDLENGNQKIELTVAAPEKQYTTEIYYFLKKIDHVLSVEVEHI